jgi:hypothetical protein
MSQARTPSGGLRRCAGQQTENRQKYNELNAVQRCPSEKHRENDSIRVGGNGHAAFRDQSHPRNAQQHQALFQKKAGRTRRPLRLRDGPEEAPTALPQFRPLVLRDGRIISK